ncbi:CsbD family protein [Ferrimicrobium acidiphilum]|uniref:CsbD family protein n=1 Tax=Ferrimicrobium acidiphilum TaxID=121039 RepID=UPI0023F3791C|nr:CsbD family protein [Ferrimicrobium acidiphilum]
MGKVDKASNKSQDIKGKAKEAVGKATNNRKLENKGKADQSKAALKNLGEDAKDAISKVKKSTQKDS